MVKIDWNIFKNKFSENPYHNFEWLCYLLFCKEHFLPYGIFRYHNQSGIETNPIEHENEQIGFQAKFYDAKLSSHKDDLLEMLIKINRDYPNLQKIILYTNQEWSQYHPGESKPAQAPQAQIDIEEKAIELGIKIEWRCASFFESSFVTNDCKDISINFFSQDENIFDFIGKQKAHNKAILSQINDAISLRDISFTLDRDYIYEQLKNAKQQFIILSGRGGIGKTVEIKKLYKERQDVIPFFIFKATEFNRINRLDETNLDGFLKWYGDNEEKIIVIDSAEKILDLENPDSVREFIQKSKENNWQVIFTTRDQYVDDLNFECCNIHGSSPLHLNIPPFETKEITKLSDEHKFKLPSDPKLIDLLRIPLYLNEYIQLLGEDNTFSYKKFKEKLWSTKIKNNQISREELFIKIAKERANTGNFFIDINNELQIAEALFNDGILGRENGLFFIAHDVYEEWALEHLINKEFTKKVNKIQFFQQIGNSLAIRRSFRSWLSEKLMLEDVDIKLFITTSLTEEQIPSFWKDEILTSIMLSDHADYFFEIFEDELLKNDMKLLKRLQFILRLSCKEIDNLALQQIGINVEELIYALSSFTKPKGTGWEHYIKYLYNQIDQIGVKNLDIFIPILFEWTNSNKIGQTTRLSALLALKYYQSLETYEEGQKKKAIKVIAYGASEIKEELNAVLSEVIDNNYSRHNDPYNELSIFILTELDGIYICKALPKKVIELTRMMWLKNYKDSDNEYLGTKDINREFGITDSYGLEYFPPSAFQTPILWLLKINHKSTIDFILDFTNITTLNFIDYSGKNNFKLEKIYFEDAEEEIFIHDYLWAIYRGRVYAPDLLKSILMALEKFLLELGDTSKSEALETVLFYLLKNSQSLVIYSVVSSIVNTYPDKTFNVAKVLFQSKSFFSFDLHRLATEPIIRVEAESLKRMSQSFGRNDKIFYEDERIKAANEKFRDRSLEDTFLYYQTFRRKEVSEEESHYRRNLLWEMLDNYYQELGGLEDTDVTKNWRLALARMDRRKMDPKVEEIEEGFQIEWNPALEPDLKEHSEQAVANLEEKSWFTSLMIWSSYKLKGDNRYKKYPKYEENPLLTLDHLKKLIDQNENNNENDELFIHSYGSILTKTSAVLIKYYQDQLSQEDLSLCINNIIDGIRIIFDDNYNYSINDATEAGFWAAPELLSLSDEAAESIKLFLLLALFRKDATSMMGGNYHDFAIQKIQELWQSHPKEAESLLFGYILLRPKYLNLRERLLSEARKSGTFSFSNTHLLSLLYEENKNIFNELMRDELSIDHSSDINQLSLNSKAQVLKMLPGQIKDYQSIFKKIVTDVYEQIFKHNNDRPGYETRLNIIDGIANYLIHSPVNDLGHLLETFTDNFYPSEEMSELIEQLIFKQDRIENDSNFWPIWNIFKPKIIELSRQYENKKGMYKQFIELIIRKYLLAIIWSENTTSWRILRPKDSIFFKEMSEEINDSPAAFYAIVKLLNDIGSNYQDEGIFWLFQMIKKNQYQNSDLLEINTNYYLEKFIRKYVYKNQQKIKKDQETKVAVLGILDFLVSKGEISAYMLRETII